jgi:hypothetical protein
MKGFVGNWMKTWPRVMISSLVLLLLFSCTMQHLIHNLHIYNSVLWCARTRSQIELEGRVVSRNCNNLIGIWHTNKFYSQKGGFFCTKSSWESPHMRLSIMWHFVTNARVSFYENNRKLTIYEYLINGSQQQQQSSAF